MTSASDEGGDVYTEPCCNGENGLHSHATSEEAYACYLDHKAANMEIQKQPDEMRRCKECGEFTQNECWNRGECPSFVPLCDAHATKENFRKHLK